MSHTRTVVSANLSEAERQQEVFKIERENSNILSNLSVLESEERSLFVNKTQQIRQWAKNYEKLAELGHYTDPINHICATITNILATHKPPLGASADLARRVLDPKYKRTEFTAINNGKLLQQQEDPQQQQQLDDTEIPIDNAILDTSVQLDDLPTNDDFLGIMNANNAFLSNDVTWVDPTSGNILTVNDKPMSEMSRDEKREAAQIAISKYRKDRDQMLESRRRQKEFVEECERLKIPLAPEFEQIAQKHISAISDDSGPSEAYFECLKLARDWDKLADKLFRWRPPKHLQKMMVQAFKAWREFLEPFIDEKHRKCQPSWWIVQMDNLWHGKHAAAVINGTPISDRMRRDLTREQVGDRATEDEQRAIRFCAAIPIWKALWLWFTDPTHSPEKKIAVRAHDLGPTLSDKSFS